MQGLVLIYDDGVVHVFALYEIANFLIVGNVRRKSVLVEIHHTRLACLIHVLLTCSSCSLVEAMMVTSTSLYLR